MTTLHFVFMISFAVMEILATSTLSADTTKNVPNVVPLKTTHRTVTTSTLSSKSPMTRHSTKTGKVTNINNTEMRIGKRVEIDVASNSSVIPPSAINVLKTNLNNSKDTRLDRSEEKKEMLKTSQVIGIHDKERNVLKNLFDKILAYKHLHLQGYGIDEKEGILREYTLLIKNKYLHRQGNERITNGGGKNGSTSKRSVKESAGYTHDFDVCKSYNDNLIEMWSKLSKYIDSAERSLPNKSVLHNISIMIRAYLDHVNPVEIQRQSQTFNTDIHEQKRIDIEDALSPVIREIKYKVDVNTNNGNDVANLTKFVIDVFRKFKGEETIECATRKEKEIASLIHFAYQQFLLKLNCDSNHNTNENILSSIGTSNSKPIKAFYKTEISSRRKALNIEYCINVATDQLLSDVKFILMKYLQYDGCQKYGTTKIGIEKLIENTLGYQTPNDKKDGNLSKYRELLRLLVNMQVRHLNHIFETPAKEIQNNIINKEALEEFLRDINNLDALINYKPQHNVENHFQLK